MKTNSIDLEKISKIALKSGIRILGGSVDANEAALYRFAQAIAEQIMIDEIAEKVERDD